MRYFRRRSHLAWRLALAALLAACSSSSLHPRERTVGAPNEALLSTTPCDAYLVEIVRPCGPLHLAKRLESSPVPTSRHALATKAKLQPAHCPIDERKHVIPARPQSQLRRDRTIQGSSNADRRGRDYSTRSADAIDKSIQQHRDTDEFVPG